MVHTRLQKKRSKKIHSSIDIFKNLLINSTSESISQPCVLNNVDSIINHGLSGVLSDQFLNASTDSVFLKLKNIKLKQKQLNTALLCEADRFKEFPIYFLKGIAHIKKIYSDLGQRPISDIDLLVKKKNLQDVIQSLKSIGYEISDENKWHANEHKTVLTKDIFGSTVAVELHTKLFYNQPENFHWQYCKEWQSLDRSDFLVHLIGHVAHQHNFIKLFWLMDIDRFIKTYNSEIDWLQVLQRAKQLKLENAMDSTFYIMTQLFENEFCLPNQKKKWTYLIDWNFLINGQSQRGRYQVLKHLLKDSWSEALSYDLGWLKSKVSPKI